jgi:hypothetical protein
MNRVWMIAKCPYCDRTPSSIPYEPVILGGALQSQYSGVAYRCGSCNKLLNVEVDFLALKSDILAGVQAIVRGH